MATSTRIFMIPALASLAFCSPFHPSSSTSWTQTDISTATESLNSFAPSTSLPTPSSSLNPFADDPTDCSKHTSQVCSTSACATQAVTTFPTNALPNSLSGSTLNSLQALLAIENLEVSLFTSALGNFSSWDVNGEWNGTEVAIQSIASQKTAHVSMLEALLQEYGVSPVEPCNYSFPISTWEDFILVTQQVSTIDTSALVGFIGDVAESEPALAGPFASYSAVAARHNAFMLGAAGRVPSLGAFETGVHMLWAYNLALRYTVSGSCRTTAPMPELAILTAEIDQSRGLVNLTWDGTSSARESDNMKPLYAAWVSELSSPIYTNITMEDSTRGHADVPPNLSGLAFVAVTDQQPAATTSLELSTLAGPALIGLS